MHGRHDKPDRRAFSLIELTIVVVIVGMLATMAIQRFNGTPSRAAQSAFARNLTGFIRAAQLYRVELGEYPHNAASGELPARWEGYVDPAVWTGETPLCGQWDIERAGSGVGFAIGVHYGEAKTPPTAALEAIDRMLDDGNLSTGAFREIVAKRFYYVLIEAGDTKALEDATSALSTSITQGVGMGLGK